MALVLASCTKDPSAAATASATAAGVATIAPAASARRPSRRYYMARREDRCEVYSVDGDEVSPTTRAPCPADLNDGERIRIVGKTCMREGTAEREHPVVCPDPLTNAEKRDLARAAASAAPAAP